MKPLFKQYLTNGIVQADTVSLARMCAYFIFYGIPYPIDDKIICKLFHIIIIFFKYYIYLYIYYIFLYLIITFFIFNDYLFQ